MGSGVPGDVATFEQAWGNHVSHGGARGEVLESGRRGQALDGTLKKRTYIHRAVYISQNMRKSAWLFWEGNCSNSSVKRQDLRVKGWQGMERSEGQ